MSLEDQPPACEWCDQTVETHPTTGRPARLCHRCQIVEAEDSYIWDQLPGRTA